MLEVKIISLVNQSESRAGNWIGDHAERWLEVIRQIWWGSSRQSLCISSRSAIKGPDIVK
jgi:hypothetical protein